MLVIDVCSFKMVCKSHGLGLGMFLNTWVTLFFFFFWTCNLHGGHPPAGVNLG